MIQPWVYANDLLPLLPRFTSAENLRKRLKEIYSNLAALESIARETQADLYFDALFERFDELAKQPHMYQAVNDIREGYRRSVCGVDSIYYRIVEGKVDQRVI